MIFQYFMFYSILICCFLTTTIQQQQLQRIQQEQQQWIQRQTKQIIPNQSNLVAATEGQNSSPINSNSLKLLSKGSEAFALELFRRISDALNSQTSHSKDFMISPFSIWSLLLLITEGAGGNTLHELNKTLRLTSDPLRQREIYKRIQAVLTVNQTTIEVMALHAIFSDINRPVERDYEDIVSRHYNANLFPVNFQNTLEAENYINSFVQTQTRGLITSVLTEKDLKDAQMVMISAIFFRGQWKYPFKESNTKKQPFHDEDKRVVGEVDMMTQTASFPYATIAELDASVLELPYGNEDRLSMVIFLPKKGVPLNSVIEKLELVGVTKIFEKLQEAADMYVDDEVEVSIPKFTTAIDLTLNVILEGMGLLDLFDVRNANLSRISIHPIYLSRLFHKTKIEVNEEGTTASAITGGGFVNKSIPPHFNANRPFAYMIFEKTTASLLFCGQIRNPSA